MNLPEKGEAIATGQPSSPIPNSYKRVKFFIGFLAGLALLFILPLYNLMRFSLQSPLYSYIPLIPFICIYLMREKRNRLHDAAETSRRAGLFFLFAGIVTLGIYWFTMKGGSSDAYLTAVTLAFVFFVLAFYLLLLGNSLFSNTAFPMLLLFFMVPFPSFMTNAIEGFFQYWSAEAAFGMLQLSNASVFRTGLEFRLPGITLYVAPECSGIRSTLVLFITSLIAGHLFLQGPWRKAALTLFVIPLAIVRNGFRIFVIAQLCIQGGPEMIDSILHKRGGPIFFALSLIPFFMLLLFLRKFKSSGKPNVENKL